MKFKSKLSDIKIRSKRSDKQKYEIENIMYLYNRREEFINFHKDCSKMIHNARYHATHGK